MHKNSNKNLKKKTEDTPLVKQYNKIKYKYPNTILLFQVGDFYETFGEDAIKSSKILNIVLTKRNNNNKSIPLAGFPYHSLNNYLPKLIQSGQRVAICNQLEKPQKGKNIVKRGVIELVTPGVTITENILDFKSNNFLASIHLDKEKMGLSFLDISTGEFFIAEDNKTNILQYLKHFNPSEIIFQRKEKKFFDKFLQKKYYTFLMDDWMFNYSFAYEKLISHFKTHSLKGFGINHLKLGIIASGVILNYLDETQHFQLKHITNIKQVNHKKHMWIDDFTFRNLEIFNCFNSKGLTLINILDKTITSMGGRLLKQWIHFPLKNIYAIQKRHKIVEELLSNIHILQYIQKKLKKISDIERLISKMVIKKISPKELITLYQSLKSIVKIKEKIFSTKKKNLLHIVNYLMDCDIISQKIIKTIHEDPPHNIEKGNIIIKGFSKKLDKIRFIFFSKKKFLEKLCYNEKIKTGIHNLKISYNNIFGYFFEIKTKKVFKIPSNWIIKQTLTNSKRYTNEELKNYELQIFNAEQERISLEKKIYYNLIDDLLNYISPLQKNAKIIAKLDVLCSFSTSALENNYIKPKMNNSFDLIIKQGRHPVIEKQFISKISYIPNDIFLNKKNQQIIIITGPNMSGKSSILRQTAIIILMAQIGSFIPAKYAKLGIIDKIFSRVGASDNISLGESTFMVEMNETASILNNLSKKSLIILDEIGRGTSTYDGISISWSILEFLHNHHFKPLTLVSTHYHELTKINSFLKRIHNYHISIKKINENIIFMRNLVIGSSEQSFGFHVAKIAGIPLKIICRSKEILKILNKKNENKIPLSKKKIFFLLKKIKFYIKDKNYLSFMDAYIKINKIKELLNN
ncbi:DNA mismatch repair protein MutS [Blattabacterium cuenoti]|uniref:DNA mismatch repair protein MutS n=1 Tax=Blattabacterium cuenoti TaxID=1653831 RepID=UPI00163B7F39|nr:DNA mismatch repair protein MutS [Blattabacterium cuenoti]